MKRNVRKVMIGVMAGTMAMILGACGGKAAPAETKAETKVETKAETTAAAGEEKKEEPAAEGWQPKGDVSVIVAYGPGGSSDLLARTFANEGASCYATPLVINNIAGGGCAIGFTELINAKPDGLTIGNTNSAVVVNCLTGETPYQYYEELQPLCQIGFAPYVVYVAKDLSLIHI